MFRGVPKDKQTPTPPANEPVLKTIIQEVPVHEAKVDGYGTVTVTLMPTDGFQSFGTTNAVKMVVFQTSTAIFTDRQYRVTIEEVVEKEETDGADEPLAQGAAGGHSHATGHGASD